MSFAMRSQRFSVLGSVSRTCVARLGTSAIAAALLTVAGCSASSGNGAAGNAASVGQSIHAVIGPEGGELVGAKGSDLEGVHVVIPAGALALPTDIGVATANDGTPLPATALRCGPMFGMTPVGLNLALPASVTVPFDETAIDQSLRFDDEVKVWLHQGDHWGRLQQTACDTGSVTFELKVLDDFAAGVNPPQPTDVVKFRLVPNPKFVRCLAQYPDDDEKAPTADVTVVRGDANDSLRLSARNIKPGLKFDVFTVEHSALDANGAPDAALTFKDVGGNVVGTTVTAQVRHFSRGFVGQTR